MFNVVIRYSDGALFEYEHVAKIAFEAYNEYEELTGDKLLTTRIPTTKHLFIFSTDGNFSLSSDGIRSIEVAKES